MGKHNHKPLLPVKSPATNSASVSSDPSLERAWKALERGFYTDAINLLERAAKHDPQAKPLLVEAYFRRAVAPKTPLEQQRKDLQRATELQPDDALYYYHLGLTYHRSGDLDAAQIAYEIAAGLQPQPRGLPFAFALAKLESDPRSALNSLAGLNETERCILDTLAHCLRASPFGQDESPLNAHLRARVAELDSSNPTLALWRGLVFVLVGDDAAAQSALDSANPSLPSLQALRHYYLGVLAARRGDLSAAVMSWQQARARGMNMPWLRENLAAVTLPGAVAALRDGNWHAAAEYARMALRTNATDRSAAYLVAVALDRLAHLAARAGNWPQAAVRWKEANEIYAQVAKSDEIRRALLQNLAIAAEYAEQWEQAAQAWRELFATKPRSKKKDPFSDAQWAWIRRRAVQDLQKAGRLVQAIALMKQKVKTTPDDLAARMELVEMLLANQQEIAARNELERILEIDPQHAQARFRLAEWHAARREWHTAEMQIKQLLEHDPQNERACKQMARLMQQHGRSLLESRQVQAAREVFEEAIRWAPNDATLYIDLGHTHLELKQHETARTAFDQAYRIGSKQLGTHEQIVRCWIIDRNLEEAKQALKRAEQELKPPPLFYVHLGLECLARYSSPSSFAMPKFGSADSMWEEWGEALIEQGIAQSPNDIELLRHIVMDSLEMQLDIGAKYAERLTTLTPNDPLAWITFGLSQAMSGDVAAAKETLRKATRLARQIGQHEAAEAANQLRRILDDPFFSFASRLGLPLGTLLGDFAEEEEFEEGEEDLFWMPPRRGRRRR